MKKFLLICINILLFTSAVSAQLYNDGLFTNDGGLISDWENQWFNTSNGVYTGSNNGIFEHHGPSSQTFINNGSHDATTGHVDQFLGPLGAAGPQEIGGNARPFFFNLDLNNGAAAPINISNTDGANVRGTATFSNGVTTTIRNIHQAGALRFESGAGYAGGNSDAQHVDGYVSKTGTEAFTFPVGSGTDLRTLSVSAPAASSEISVAWFNGDPSSITDPSDGNTHSAVSTAGPILAVNKTGFWDWVPVAGSDDGLNVTVSIPDLSGFAAPADLRLVGWDGAEWIDLSGAATASGNGENSTVSGTIPSGTTITAIGIGSVSFVLPVHFASFTVTAGDCNPVIRWSTATEDNNDYFEVERSHNRSGFVVIATLQGAGSTSILQQYEYIDQNAEPGNSLYRVRQVNSDRNSSYTQIRSILIDCAEQNAIKVYPTVSSTTITVRLPEAYKNAKLSLVDISGRQINVAIKGSNQQKTVELSSLPAAQYFLLIVNNSEMQTFKILKP